jgi:hypothetical protein
MRSPAPRRDLERGGAQYGWAYAIADPAQSLVAPGKQASDKEVRSEGRRAGRSHLVLVAHGHKRAWL